MSLHKAVTQSAAKLGKKGLRGITVSKSANGGFIAEHNHNEYDHPDNNKKYTFKNAKEVAHHISKHMPSAIKATDEDSD